MKRKRNSDAGHASRAPVTTQEVRIAPIPSAHEIQEYNSVSPDLGVSIVENWTTESSHRREMESRVISLEEASRNRRHQYLV